MARLSITALAVGSAQFHFSQAMVAAGAGTLYWPQTLDSAVLIEPNVSQRSVSVRSEASSPEQVIVSSASDANPIVVERVVDGKLEIIFDSQSAIVVDAPGHLACTVNAAADSVITLRAGDVNDDNHIDLLDAATVGIEMNQSLSGPADVNGDQRVDIYDLIAVGRNYGRSMGACG
ncbi:MAG: hypothetical protein IPO91_03335 [Chloroflexi bacterium]|nr:hypothetical protein [Chloroflexota bacterium]